jgi:hypothetical protein
MIARPVGSRLRTYESIMSASTICWNRGSDGIGDFMETFVRYFPYLPATSFFDSSSFSRKQKRVPMLESRL